ncbi:MAG: DUF2497 domain-containing protein [Alphaproteobacteria bacterium]
MGNPQQAQEPTMEEILASIRRIIADDDEEQVQDAQMEKQGDDHANDDVESDADAEQVEASEAEDQAQVSNDSADAAEDDAAEDDPVAQDEPAAQDEPDAEVEAAVDAVDEDDDDVFELSEIADDVEPSAPVEDEPEEAMALEDDIAFEDQPAPEPEPEPAPAPEPEFAAPPAAPVGDVLLSQEAQSSASTAFGELASSMLSYSGGARTLEGIVEDLLRPLLKAWLDENLPPMVEQMVREEIERVARRR